MQKDPTYLDIVYSMGYIIPTPGVVLGRLSCGISELASTYKEGEK